MKDRGKSMKVLYSFKNLPEKLAQLLAEQQNELEQVLASQQDSLKKELHQLVAAHQATVAECENLRNLLVAATAEKDQLAAVNQALFRSQEVELNNSLSNRIGNIMIRAVDSPSSIAGLPFKLRKFWREAKTQQPSKFFEGESFSKVLTAYADGGFNAVKALMDEASVSPTVKANGYTALARHLKNDTPELACEAACYAYEEDPQPFRRKWLAFRLYEAGDVLGAGILLNTLSENMPLSASEMSLAKKIKILAKGMHKSNAQTKLTRYYKKATDLLADESDQAKAQCVAVTEYHTTGLPVADADGQFPQKKLRRIFFLPEKENGPLLNSDTHKKARVACVMDDFTFLSYAPECQLCPLTPDNAIEELEAFHPNILFIESAWRGKDNLWDKKIGHLCDELRNVIAWCKERQIPTVFWNKEDPVHFETFLSTAQQFDYVFTTDIDCIARYKAILGHDQVYLLPFACQPQLHNPVERYPRKDAFCFAGAYYVRYPERSATLNNYMTELTKFRPLEIFDRNLNKDDANYKFPEEYQPFIVGNLPFEEIDKAYKGYKYAINLNSMKQSQTMFARRVYELLGSNTLTISNFSRGLRLLFGDIVISCDDGQEIVKRLLDMDEESRNKVCLAGLRKVMQEHCYAHRMQYVLHKVLGWQNTPLLPVMVFLALAESIEQYEQILTCFQSQTHTSKRLLVMLGKNVAKKQLPTADRDEDISIVALSEAAQQPISSFVRQGEWVALMNTEDYYGPNYLLDIALATQYSDARLIGKGTRYQWTSSGSNLFEPGCTYSAIQKLPVRCSAVHVDALPKGITFSSLFADNGCLEKEREIPGLAIDAFNYCQGGQLAKDQESLHARVNDLNMHTGFSFDKIARVAEAIEPATTEHVNTSTWDGNYLYDLFKRVNRPQIHIENTEEGLSIQSKLPDGMHDYIYAAQEFSLETLAIDGEVQSHLEASPGLHISYVFFFLDKDKNKISHVIHTANKNCTATTPKGASFIRFGLRIYNSGQAVIKNLIWGHRNLEPETLLNRSNILLLTNHYPSYEDLYRNAFVHSRVTAYKKRGVNVDVFRLRPGEALVFHEFQNIDVTTGGKNALCKLLDSGQYTHVLVHFLSPDMWEVLKQYPQLKVIIWVHGAEIQPWYRRAFNYQTEPEREKAKQVSEQRMTFWKEVLNNLNHNVHLVFVSQYLAGQSMVDLDIRIPAKAYSIIHNPIDTCLFSYSKKQEKDRVNILSIRPYTSRTYANDLTVDAILLLKDKLFFNELSFLLVGNGELFENTVAPLRSFPNITLKKSFLTQVEIADLHKHYGVFLVPTRMDTQGVSRDEAMSSGLVPITNRVAAVPEFVDESCGLLAEPEEAIGLALAIEEIYRSPELFAQLSESAAKRVRQQRGIDTIISKEFEIMNMPTSYISTPHI